jgi:hypothetical protein
MMSIRVVRHSEEFETAAKAFNDRMSLAGSSWGVYLHPDGDWLVKRSAPTVWREHYLAVDEIGEVRGGYVLKPQEWWIRGKPHTVTDWQGPVSEGSINSKYATLAVRLMREMAKAYPTLFSWGHGGADQPVVQMLEKMKWPMYGTPFCLLVLKPYRFARHNAYLRRTFAHRVILDLLAFSGIAYLAIRGFQLKRQTRIGADSSVKATTFDRFEEWADELWEACKSKYTVIATRDSTSMNCLAPESDWPPVTRLRVEKAGAIVGWALVMETQMRSDVRFGSLHVGSLVDCLANPVDAGDVVRAATAFLAEKGVDIVVSNQSHPDWVRGFAENGYLVLPNRRLFVSTPQLRELLEPFEETALGLHLTNMDGHGPHAL